MHLLNRREAQGRLKIGQPVAIIDIGSNSVRLVAYEGLARSLTPIYNEKVLCGLGRHVATTGRLDEEAARLLASATQVEGVNVVRRAFSGRPVDEIKGLLEKG